ncbi:10422_t:CDS:2, partial [Cetraspora pellucida]
ASSNSSTSTTSQNETFDETCIDSAWKKCLSVLLGENIETSDLQEIIKTADHAIFITPLSLEPVILNLKKCTCVDECEIPNLIPQNSIGVELKITTNSPETLLFVEEALLGRLDDFSNTTDSADKIGVGEAVRPTLSQKVKEQLINLKTDRDSLIGLHGRHENNEDGVTWDDFVEVSKQTESRTVEVVSSVRNEMNNMWLNGVVEL